MINEGNMRLFVAALRNPDERQGPGALEQVDSKTGLTYRCCLGVACRVAMANGVGLAVFRMASGDVSFDGKRGVLPHKVTEFLGFNEGECDPVLTLADGTRRTAVACNDQLNMTFPEIADAFERTFLEGK